MSDQVVFVDGEDLPAGKDWMYVETPQTRVLALRRSRITPQLLTEVWRALDQVRPMAPPVRVPAQRHPSGAERAILRVV